MNLAYCGTARYGRSCAVLPQAPAAPRQPLMTAMVVLMVMVMVMVMVMGFMFPLRTGAEGAEGA